LWDLTKLTIAYTENLTFVPKLILKIHIFTCHKSRRKWKWCSRLFKRKSKSSYIISSSTNQPVKWVWWLMSSKNPPYEWYKLTLSPATNRKEVLKETTSLLPVADCQVEAIPTLTPFTWRKMSKYVDDVNLAAENWKW